MEKRNLLISAVGREGLYPHWMSGSPQFDFVALCYEELAERIPGALDQRSSRGYKFDLVDEYISGNPWVSDYDAVFVPDDDLLIDAAGINALFAVFHEYQLALAQPALTRESYYSHKITRQCGRSDVVLRYTNFVEVMCPLFSRVAFDICRRTFLGGGSGYGLDFVWPKLLGFESIAVIDSVCVHHGRPVNSYKRLKKDGINPRKLIRTVAEKYGSEWYTQKTLRYVRSRP